MEVGKLIENWLDRFDALLDRWYARQGVWVCSLLVAMGLLVVAHSYVNGGIEPVSHGVHYAAASEGPFNLSYANEFRTRMFAPLIGWVFHLRGPLYVLVPWLFLAGTLALVNVWFRREGAAPMLGLSIMLALAFSPVIFHSMIGPGFVEGVSYFFLAMGLVYVRRTVVSCACMAAAVMTHEASVFLIPAWLLLLPQQGRLVRSSFQRMALLAVMLLPYAVFRAWVAHYDATTLTTTFYFSKQNIDACLAVGPLATLKGIFGVFRLHWLVVGLAFLMGGPANVRLRWALLLVVSLCLTLIIAFDTTRMLCWAFPVLAVSAVELSKRIGRTRTVVFLMSAWVLNFLITPYTTTGAASYQLNELYEFLNP